MMKAYVLINVRVGSVPEVVQNLRRLEGILEASMTFGPYDAVATVEADDINKLGHLIAAKIQPIPGVLNTITCLVVEP
jgi:DNA-binding Lrp family transcriptional regulator